MKNRRSISKRIMAGIIGVLAVTFIITTLLYITLSDKYIVGQTKIELRRAGEAFETSFDSVYFTSQDGANDRLKIFKLESDISVLKKVLNINTIVIGANDKVIFPKERMTIEQVEKLKRESRLESSNYVVYEHLFKDESIPIKSIVLYKRYKDVTVLKNEGIKTLIKSFLIGLVIAVIIGYSLSQRIYKPIKSLRISMSEYIKGNKKEVVVYQSKDEIQDLSEVFKSLTDKIDRLNDRQKQFFQNSSHELKTPLMSIQGYAEAIKDGIVKGEELDNSLDIIISETQRLKNIVDDVIYLSKIDDLEDQLVSEPEDMKKIIEEAIPAAAPLLNVNKIDVELNCEEEVMFNCDFEKMKRVFINLIGNGSRYADSKIIVNVTRHNNSVMIDVIDDGKGFEFGQEEKVFDRFYNGKKGGSGIGLALTKEIIEKHGGKIVAINNINHGAIFKITFM